MLASMLLIQFVSFCPKPDVPLICFSFTMLLKITAYLSIITIFIQLIDQLSKQTSYEDHNTESMFLYSSSTTSVHVFKHDHFFFFTIEM